MSLRGWMAGVVLGAGCSPTRPRPPLQPAASGLSRFVNNGRCSGKCKVYG